VKRSHSTSGIRVVPTKRRKIPTDDDTVDDDTADTVTDDDAAEDDAAEDTDNGNDADEDEVDDEVTTFVVLSYLYQCRHCGPHSETPWYYCPSGNQRVSANSNPRKRDE